MIQKYNKKKLHKLISIQSFDHKYIIHKKNVSMFVSTTMKNRRRTSDKGERQESKE